MLRRCCGHLAVFQKMTQCHTTALKTARVLRTVSYNLRIHLPDTALTNDLSLFRVTAGVTAAAEPEATSNLRATHKKKNTKRSPAAKPWKCIHCR